MQPFEKTLILLKPDAVERALVGRILARFEDKGLFILAMKMLLIDRTLAETHYGVHKGKPFYEDLLDFITSGPVLAAVLSGKYAIEITRMMMGATFGPKAAPGTIRGDFGPSYSHNLIHGSDSPESAEREIALFFKPDEILDWEPMDMRARYDFFNGQAE